MKNNLDFKAVASRLSSPIDEGYSVESINGFNSYFLGKGINDETVFFIKQNGVLDTTYSGFGGEYLKIMFNIEVELEASGDIIQDSFTILELKKTDSQSVFAHFLDVCMDITEKFGDHPDFIVLSEYLEKTYELFSRLKKNSSIDELGLWGELFVLSQSRNKEKTIDSWHVNPNDTFDFNSGDTILEVKTTQLDERIHVIKYNQLELAIVNKGFICSIMTSKIEVGFTINDLIDKITSQISFDYKMKFREKIMDVAGIKIHDFKTNFDLKAANNSIQFYRAEGIPNIRHIPEEIRNIKFDIRLENIQHLNNTTDLPPFISDFF